MSYSSTCTSFTYTGEDFGTYANIPVTWKSIEIDCSDDWRGVADTNPFPKDITIRASISVTNNSGSTVTWTSTSPKFYLLGSDSTYYDNPHLDDMINMGAWAYNKDITIAAGRTVNLTQTFKIDWSANIYDNTNTYQYGYQHFLNILQQNTARFFLGIPQINFWAGYRRVNATFNFTYPQNIYDYRAWPHRTARYEVYEPIQQYGISATPSTFSNFCLSATGFDGTIKLSVIHSQGVATTANNPDIRIKCEEINQYLPITYQTNYSASTYNIYTFGVGCKELFANYFRNNRVTTATTFNFTIEFRNPFKFNSLPIGSMIILPDNTVYEVKKTGDSSKYYQPSWVEFSTIQVPFTVTPKSNVSSFYISGGGINRIVKTGEVDTGCFYAPNTKPTATLTYTAGWGVKSITINPQGDGWHNYPSFVFNLPTPTADTTTGTIVLTQPDYYPYSMFSESETEKTVAMKVVATPSVGNERTLYQYSSNIVFKYVPLAVTSYSGYRSTSTGVRDVNGDYIGMVVNFRGNEMAWSSSRKYNPITKHMTIKTLADGQIVFNDDITLNSGVVWTSANSYELGAETSYFVEVTLSDKFTSTTFKFNIGTKVAYLEFGDDAKSLAIGKYCEKEGWEIQFPVFFAKQVVILPKGKEKFKEIASAIPYEDTYNIGCSNVQEVLNWLNGRLS